MEDKLHGTRLVCCNNESENSYGNEQAYNSCVSEKAMNKYVESLNYLLKSPKNKVIIDDMTVVYWSMTENNENEDFFNAFMLDNSEISDKELEDNLKGLIDDVKEGSLLRKKINEFNKIKPDVDFYIIGLKPNVSRISLKFIYKKKFGDIIYNVVKHQDDLQIGDNIKPIKFWQIKKELISPHISKNTKNQGVNSALISKIYESIIMGTNYPEALLEIIVRRLKTDVSDELYVNNRVRIGIVKAVINRKLRLSGQKEEIKMSLDYENLNQAYLCGRLFAILETIQKDSTNNSINRTIKDAYFASASSTPAAIFPKLIKLSQYHLSKLSTGKSVYWNKKVGEVIGKLDEEFPSHLLLKDQGRFMIGYYQQIQEIYKERINKEEE